MIKLARIVLWKLMVLALMVFGVVTLPIYGIWFMVKLRAHSRAIGIDATWSDVIEQYKDCLKVVFTIVWPAMIKSNSLQHCYEIQYETINGRKMDEEAPII